MWHLKNTATLLHKVNTCQNILLKAKKCQLAGGTEGYFCTHFMCRCAADME